jgi:hypothetical protein
MAGAIPIAPGAAECDMIRSLSDARLSVFLATLDELDWCAARSLLPVLAELQQADNQQSEKTGDTQ